MTDSTSGASASGRILDVLNVLLGHFAHGLTPGEIAKATNLPPPNITRYVVVLEKKGFAERIPETGRIRPSVRLAQHAVTILRSIDSARQRAEELQTRITTPCL